MDEAVPVIYGGGDHTSDSSMAAPQASARATVRPIVPNWARLVALGIAMACLAVLIRAATLPPSPTGVGTHTKMGLGACQFQVQTALPCPSCGMTTSFAWFARGNVLASAYVQPMGAALAFAAACTVWGGVYVALTGRPVYRLLRLLPGRYYVVPLLALAVLAWAWKIFIQLAGRDGWN